MEENKGNMQKAPLAYAILGVTVLVLAIAGSTFAYFTASANADTPIEGEALSIKLGVTMSKVSKVGENGEGLIPIYDGSVTEDEDGASVTSQLQAAASATNQCVDTKKYTVCQVYEISLTNTGEDSTTVDVTLNINKKSLSNLKWANMTDATTVSTGSNAIHDITSNVDAVVIEDVALTKDNTEDNPVKKYIMVYVNNTGTAQTDTGDFTGVVTVTASTGDKVQATF